MIDRLPGDVIPPPEILTVPHTQHGLRRELSAYYKAINA